MFELSLIGLALDVYTIYANLTIKASQTMSVENSENGIIMIGAATGATKLEIALPLSEQAILHKGKPAKANATKKWAHALDSEFPELTNKSDSELTAAIRRLRAR